MNTDQLMISAMKMEFAHAKKITEEKNVINVLKDFLDFLSVKVLSASFLLKSKFV